MHPCSIRVCSVCAPCVLRHVASQPPVGHVRRVCTVCVPSCCVAATCQPGVCRARQTCVVVAGAPTCVCRCEGARCRTEGEVCGSDGVTYDSELALEMQACSTDSDTRRRHHGKCAGEWEGVKLGGGEGDLMRDGGRG